MGWQAPAPPPHRSGVTTALAVVGGVVLIVVAGVGIGFLVLFLAGSNNDSGDAAAEAQPTVTVTSMATETASPDSPGPAPTVTVTTPPTWPPGYWSAGSPCLIPYTGVELGLEYGYTRDPTIKSWVYGVQELIQRLFDQGWAPTSPGPLDGEYGAKTEAGVLGFQSAYGIPTIGRVGGTTWATLRNQCDRFR